MRRGGSLELKMGGARISMPPLEGSGRVPRAVGDVRDMSLGVDGGMERGDAQILPPTADGNMRGQGGKGEVGWKGDTTKILKRYHAEKGWGGGGRVSGGVGMDRGVLGLPHRVRTRPLQQLVHSGVGGEEAHEAHSRNPKRGLPPQLRRPGLPWKL